MPIDRLRSRWVWVVAFALLLVASSAAVVVLQAAVSPREPTLRENLTTNGTELEGFSATRRTVIERGNETVRTVERVWRRPGTGAYRIKQITGDRAGSELRVSNGSVLWLYDEDEANAIVVDIESAEQAHNRSRIQQLVNVVQRGGGTRGTTTKGVRPLPVVPPDGYSTASTVGIAGPLTVTYEGIETVSGRATHVFRVTSNANVSAVVSGFNQTLWIDRQWLVPIKRVTSYRRDGQHVSITVTYENLTFNPDLDASVFRFDPPANVTIERSDAPRQRRFVDVAGLRAAAEFSVPEPSLPESFRLVAATRTTGGIRSIGLRYRNATALVTVSKLNRTFRASTEGRLVRIGDRNATLRNLGTELRVSWNCEGVRYSVAAKGLSADALVRIASSVDCE